MTRSDGDQSAEVVVADLDAFETLRVALIAFLAGQRLGGLADGDPSGIVRIVMDARDLALVAQEHVRPLAAVEPMGQLLVRYRLLLARVELMAGQIMLSYPESTDAAHAELYEAIAELLDLRPKIEALAR
jgi:hypothetical protein